MKKDRSNGGRESTWSQLRLLSVKLRSLAYLLGTLATTEDPPLDFEEIHMGYGLLLDEIARDMRRVSTEMEKEEIQRLRK